ncbi:MAG: hypothetical protein WAX69_05525, partial [Victivallales bacterium]
NPLKADSDSDGINDFQEIWVYNTDPMLSDTDGDGVSDWQEVEQYFTNPIVADINPGDLQNVFDIPGVQTTGRLGTWWESGNEIFSLSCRGHLEYALPIQEADIYSIKIEGRENYGKTASFDLKIYIDDEYIGKRTISSQAGQPANTEILTPFLNPGQHGIRIYLDGYSFFNTLRVSRLSIQRYGGSDSDNNGIKDWIDSRLQNLYSVDNLPLLGESKVSPMCLEGRGRFLKSMSVSGGSPVRQGIGHRWYSDVALAESGVNDIAVSFDSGLKTVTGQVIWKKTNILAESGDISIRKGDSLLLAAHPADALDGSFAITVNGSSFDGTPENPVQHNFDTAGTFAVTGTYTAPDGTVQSGSITVKAIAYDFALPEQICWAGKTRYIDVAKVPQEVVLENDPRIFFSLSSNYAATDRYSLTTDQNEDRYIVARLGQGGPVLAALMAKGFAVYSSHETYVQFIEKYADGSSVYEMAVVSSPLHQEELVNLSIFVSGVVFDDGHTSKTLQASDFNDAGVAKVRFVQSASSTTSVCHSCSVYQGSTVVGTR